MYNTNYDIEEPSDINDAFDILADINIGIEEVEKQKVETIRMEAIKVEDIKAESLKREAIKVEMEKVEAEKTEELRKAQEKKALGEMLINWEKIVDWEVVFNAEKEPIREASKIIWWFVFFIKYIMTSVVIFGVLLLGTNYSAYSNIAKSYMFEDQNTETTKLLLESIDNSDILKSAQKKAQQEEIRKRKEDIENDEIENEEKKLSRSDTIKKNAQNAKWSKSNFSIRSLVSDLNKEVVELDVSIVPYENRILIPKIWKNIPLIEVLETTVENQGKLNNIFMKELEDWVVRYPWSARPGEKWNAFIFGHSSNFPWIKWKYNDVFARLGQLQVGDTVYSYYWQKRYKYKIKEKKVVGPNNVKILKRDKNKQELTLMTCWPIGTTLNRLILIAELVED